MIRIWCLSFALIALFLGRENKKLRDQIVQAHITHVKESERIFAIQDSTHQLLVEVCKRVK